MKSFLKLVVCRESTRRLSAIVTLLGLSAVAHATQTSTTGTLTVVRTNASTWGGASLGNVSTLQLSSALSGGCVWLYVAAADTIMLSTVLASKASGASVTIWYDNTVTSPWGDTTTCLAESLQQN